MVTTAPRDLQKPAAKKICARLRVLPLHQNHTYPDLPRCLSGAVSQSSLKCRLPGRSPRFAPNKTELTTLTRCAF